MTGYDLVFAVLALTTAGAGIMTVTSRNLVHAALFLALTLTGSAAVFLVLAADFVALAQLLVNVGAVVILFLFGLMLTRAPIGREALDGQHRGLAIGVSGSLFVLLSVLIIQAFGGEGTKPVAGPGIEEIGFALFAQWVLPFEVLSMLLLAALIGAIVLARRSAGESGEEAEPTRIALSDDPTTEQDRLAALDASEARGELPEGGGR